MSTSTAGTVRRTSSALPPFAVGMSRTTYVFRSGASWTSWRRSVTATDSSASATFVRRIVPMSTLAAATVTGGPSTRAYPSARMWT
ncbi:hypothetical protein BH11GEM2_BH11GEM2_31530 [soil metagenome]